MKARIHLLDCSEPLISFHRLIVRCGVEIENAQLMFGWVEELESEMNLPFNLCPNCVLRTPFGSEKRRFLYGLIEMPRRAEKGVKELYQSLKG
jgi:hypothetical protein